MFSIFLVLLVKAILLFIQKKFEGDMFVITEKDKTGLKVKLAFNITLTETHSEF